MQRSTAGDSTGNIGLTLNEDVSDEIVDLYINLAPGYLADLIAARNAGDIKSLKFQAHKLASVMGVMGFDEMNKLLIRMEHEEMDDIELSQSIERISAGMDESLALIESVRR